MEVLVVVETGLKESAEEEHCDNEDFDVVHGSDSSTVIRWWEVGEGDVEDGEEGNG